MNILTEAKQFLIERGFTQSDHTMPNIDGQTEMLKHLLVDFYNHVTKPKKVLQYNYDIKRCPGYEGHTPSNLSHEVCKHCGNIEYYH